MKKEIKGKKQTNSKTKIKKEYLNDKITQIIKKMKIIKLRIE